MTLKWKKIKILDVFKKRKTEEANSVKDEIRLRVELKNLQEKGFKHIRSEKIENVNP